MTTSLKHADKTSHPDRSPPRPAAIPQPPVHPELETYWAVRKRYLGKIRTIPELRRRYVKEGLAYLFRRLLWSFGFFPLFLGFWIPLVIARFNPVAMVQDLLPHLQGFVTASPQVQANNLETLVVAWLSVGFIFAVFDFILTPFKSPYDYEADVHMKAWQQLQTEDQQQKPAQEENTGAPASDRSSLAREARAPALGVPQ